jgi:DNA-directed RNA polymerase specialized sigma24 family protein
MVEEQDLLYMHYVHSTPGKDLAVMFGISPASVRKKIERACKKLEKLIEEDGYGK